MKKYRLSFLFAPIAFLLNIVTLNVSVIVAYYLKFQNVENLFEPPYVILFWFLNLAWLSCLVILKPSKRSRISFNIPTLIFNYSKIILFLPFIISLFWICSRSYFYPRKVLFCSILFTAVLGFISRIITFVILKAYRSIGRNARSFAILGECERTKQIQSYYAQSPELGFKNLVIFVKDSKISNNMGVLFGLCRNKTVDIVVGLPYIDGKNIRKLSKLLENYLFEMKIISDFRGFIDKSLSVEYHRNIPVLSVSKIPYSDQKVELTKLRFYFKL